MSARTVRTTLPVNPGSVDPRYTSAMDRAYWTVKYIDSDGEKQEFDHHGPTSVKQKLESMGIPFDVNVEVEFHKP